MKQWLKHPFIKGFLTLFAGNAIAQFLSLCCLPVLSRLYSPDEFGLLALFATLSIVLSLVGTARLEVALVVAKAEDVAKLLDASLLLSRVVTVLSILPVALYALFFFDHSTNNHAQWLFLLLPLGGKYNAEKSIFVYLLNRTEAYRPIAQSRVWLTTVNTIAAVLLGFVGCGAAGLIIPFVLSAWWQNEMLKREVKRLNFSVKPSMTSFAELLQRVKPYRDFPLYSFPMSLLNNLSVDMMIYVFTLSFGEMTTGLYTQARKVIQFPLTTINNAFSTVFYKRITHSNAPERLYLTSGLLSAIGALALLWPLLLWGEALFCFVLGNQWAESGRMAVLLVPFFVVNFAVVNVSSVFDSLMKNRIELIWQMVYFVVSLLIVYLCAHLGVTTLLLVYSLWGVLMYLLLFVIGWSLLKRRLP